MKITFAVAALFVASLALSGCVTTPPKEQVLDQAAIATVQARIKNEIAVYIAATQAEAKNSSSNTPDQFWCGSGDIDFDIASIKVDLTVTNETIKNAGIKAKIPLNAIEVDPSGKAATDVTNSEELVYNLWPVEDDQQTGFQKPTSRELEGAPIARVLLDLRKTLIDSAKKTVQYPQACFTDYNPDKPAGDAGNTFKLGLSFVNDVTGGFELTVGALDITDSTESKGTTGNTLTVSFVQRNLKNIQILKDAVDKQCGFPDFGTPKCKIAGDALHLVTTDSTRFLGKDKALKQEVQTFCTPKRKGDDPTPECLTAKALLEIAETTARKGEAFSNYQQ